MGLPIDLLSVLRENRGMMTTAQANAVGVSNERLRLLVKSGDLERVAQGVYILPDEFEDKMYIAQLRRPKMIYSHETALYLHDLTDRDPINYSVTVPTGYNASRLKADGFTVYMIHRDRHNIGVSEKQTLFGNSVVVYNMERTICDCMRNWNQLDIAVGTDALKRYAKRKDKDLNQLLEMARMFKVTERLRYYLEVLL